MINFMDKVSNSTAEEIFDILDDVGIKQHYKGYNYLACAISIVVNNSPRKVSITKEVYPEVAKIFGGTPTSVERCLRHCIEELFYKGDLDIIYKYFGNSVDKDKGKVTNSQFIYTMANFINKKYLIAS